MILQKIQRRLKKTISFLRELQETNSPDLLGLDINSSFIKLLQISHKKPHSIEHFVISKLPAGASVQGEIQNFDIVMKTLKKMLKNNKIETKNVALAIPRLTAIIKKFHVDKRLTPNEIESRTWLEADRFFPNLIGDIYLDFVELGIYEKDPSQKEIMLVASRKEQLEPYLKLFRKHHLYVKIVDVDTYALERALSLITHQHKELETMGLLNFDAKLISLLVVHKNEIVYTHELNHENNLFLTKAKKYIKENPAINFAEDATYLEILQEGITSSIRHTMQFFYSNKNNMAIQKMFLAGDMATLPHLDKYIQQITNVETEKANPFENMKIANTVDKDNLLKYAPALMLSCGLALTKTYDTN